MSYKQVLDLLLNGDLCIGVYDIKLKIWRTAIYIRHFDKSQTITIGFTTEQEYFYRFAALKNFPINYLCYDTNRFKTNEKELRVINELISYARNNNEYLSFCT